jgi:hypothetical protein
MKKPMTKAELYARMERFANDEKRVISWPYLGELAGFTEQYLRQIFVDKTKPLTDTVQMRLSKALERVANGDVTLVYFSNQKRELVYNNTPKPRLIKGGKLVMRDGRVQLEMGPVNRGDYSRPTLQETLGKK